MEGEFKFKIDASREVSRTEGEGSKTRSQRVSGSPKYGEPMRGRR